MLTSRGVEMLPTFWGGIRRELSFTFIIKLTYNHAIAPVTVNYGW
jgi:hypothetical protein